MNSDIKWMFVNEACNIHGVTQDHVIILLLDSIRMELENDEKQYFE